MTPGGWFGWSLRALPAQPTQDALPTSLGNLLQFTTRTLSFCIRMRRSPLHHREGRTGYGEASPVESSGGDSLLSAKLGPSQYPGVSKSQQQSPHCSPMAGNVTVAIPKQVLSAPLRGQPSPDQPLPLDISLWPQRPRLAHPSPGLLKRVCPEWKMHCSRPEGSSEERQDGSGLKPPLRG